MTLQRSTKLLALGFLGSGAIHLVKPEVYEPIMPSWVPSHREVILGSGVAEIVLGVGLLAPATRRVAGWGSLGLLLGVYPANLKMATDALGGDNTALKVGALARLPGQWPMLKAAWTATRR